MRTVSQDPYEQFRLYATLTRKILYTDEPIRHDESFDSEEAMPQEDKIDPNKCALVEVRNGDWMWVNHTQLVAYESASLAIEHGLEINVEMMAKIPLELRHKLVKKICLRNL